MPPPLALRPFAPADLAVLHRIREAAFAPVFASFRALVGEEIAAIAFASAEAEQGRHLDEICADGSGHHVFAVMEGAEMVGFVAFSVDADRRTGELGLNAIHPDHAGRGIGTWMYEEALARMKALGAEVVEVGTGADPSHAPARRAYQKAGFLAAIPGVHFYRRL
jgi:ribosomal protein S18 acetylase RimI-like enzyme